MRRGTGDHLIRSEKSLGQYSDGSGERMEFLMFCGETQGFKMHVTSDPTSSRCCSKCSAAYWGEKLKAEPNGFTLGERDRDLVATLGVKSAYPILNAEAEMVGAVVIENGWGKTWSIHHLHSTGSIRSVEAGEEMGAEVSRSVLEWEDEPEPGKTWARGHKAAFYASKERALAAVPEMAERLPSAAKVVAKAKAWVERYKARVATEREEEEANAAKLAADLAHITEAFRELLASEAVSNYQREGLALAAGRLGVKLDDLQEPS